MKLVCVVAVAFYFVVGVLASPRPVVIWHGMGDVCCDPLSMGYIMGLITKNIPGVYIYSVEIGGNIISDELGGFIGNVDNQVAQVCQTLRSDPNLQNGFNAVGFSQGGQFLRAYVERCNNPPVYNLVTMGGQHQGVADIPTCVAINETICSLVDEFLAFGAYTDLAQALVVQAQYFHDPMTPDAYLTYNHFLTDINNDNAINTTYKQNLISLNNLVLVLFSDDVVVIPKESAWFGFYPDNNPNIVVPLNATKLYLEDRIGLKTLNENGKLVFDVCPGGHMHVPSDWFTSHVINKYLNK